MILQHIFNELIHMEAICLIHWSVNNLPTIHIIQLIYVYTPHLHNNSLVNLVVFGWYL